MVYRSFKLGDDIRMSPTFRLKYRNYQGFYGAYTRLGGYFGLVDVISIHLAVILEIVS